MARRKASDKKGTDKKNRAAREETNNVQADNNSIAFEKLEVGGNIGGGIRIGHTIGYTAEQVSVLLKQITTTFQPKKFDRRCPYKGLEVFEEEDAELFFGRERLVNELVGRVKESRTVFITGPSGSGKSSLVRAGLIHALKQGGIKSSDRWLYETMKPGREPLKDLALAFSRLKSPELQDYFLGHSSEGDILDKCAESILSGRKEQRFVLFIDQFEEVFTQINSEEERLAFINMLAYAGTVENGRVIVLFAMRSDFVSNCATYPALNELLSQEFRQIGAMQPEELVSAIALPAMHVGLPIEHELISQIINDMGGEPDALPLMQFALKDLFDAKQAEGGVIALSLRDYLGHGGIHKSLERHADATFAKLSESEQELTRSIFSGLIEIGRGTQDTKRTALFDELIPANKKAEEVLVIVQKLADARLIVTDEQAGKDTVTISHEKLIEAWPWLKKLVNENRDVIALQNEIANDAKEWGEHKRDVSYLYSGARLVNANEQLKSNKLVLSGAAFEYIRAGQARQRRGRVVLTGAISILFVLLATAVVIFASLTKEAQKQTNIARGGELAALAVYQRERQFDLSLLLSIQAFRTADTGRTRSVLLEANQTNPQLVQYIHGREGDENSWSMAFSPDGNAVAIANGDQTIIFRDIDRQGARKVPTGDDSAYHVVFSSDGELLAAAGGTNIILWDAHTYQPIGQPLTGYAGDSNVVFSPDGKTLAAEGNNNRILLWDVDTHQPIGQPLQGHSNIIESVAFSPDGKILASAGYDSNIIFWDVSTHQSIGQPIPVKEGNVVYHIIFSPDGKMLAVGGLDGTIVFWDVSTHQSIGQPLTGYDGVSDVVFSPDGKTLAAGYGNAVMLWDVDQRRPIDQPLNGHSDSVISMTFSPDGKTLVSGSADKEIILWDVKTRQPLINQPSKIPKVLRYADSSVRAVFSPNRKTLARGSSDRIVLWDVNTDQPVCEPLKANGMLRDWVFSPDSKILAVGSKDKTIVLWDAATCQAIGQPLQGHTDSILSLAYSPNGKILASSSVDNTIILWDVNTYRSIGRLSRESSDSVSNVVFSPDGKLLALGADSTILLWDVATHQPVGQPLQSQTGDVKSVAFSPDGDFLASGTDSTIILWDVATHQPVGQSLQGHTRFVTSVAFSLDGKMLVSGGADSKIILWDVATRQPIGQPLHEFDPIIRMALSPDGKFLVTENTNGMITLWEITPERWLEFSCQRAGRNFTRAEWAAYFPNEEYRKTCEQWPLEAEATPIASPTP